MKPEEELDSSSCMRLQLTHFYNHMVKHEKLYNRVHRQEFQNSQVRQDTTLYLNKQQ